MEEATKKQSAWLTPREVAEKLNLTVEQVMPLIRHKNLPAVKLSRKVVRINAEKLDQLLNQSGE